MDGCRCVVTIDGISRFVYWGGAVDFMGAIFREGNPEGGRDADGANQVRPTHNPVHDLGPGFSERKSDSPPGPIMNYSIY